MIIIARSLGGWSKSDPHLKLLTALAHFDFSLDRPTKDQFRIQGRAYLYSGPDSPNQNYLPAHLYPFEGFDWEEERLRIFAKMSPPLKASFLRPVPGTALDQTDYDYKKLPQELSDEDHDKEWREKAYKNFSLIVIDPEEVDLCVVGFLSCVAIVAYQLWVGTGSTSA